MTKTYNDIDVVTHLLAERDRDLELAARIGQSLLQRNHVLQERNESLEEQLAQAIDQVHQLQHELAKKDELLRMVASASEESETDSSCSTPLRHPAPAGAALALSQLEALQSKLQELEEENLSLRSEACHLKKETITYEEKEQQLVSDCVKELREYLRRLSKKEELRIHLRASKEAQRQLTAELKELSDRNAECVGMLHESQEEIKELRSKNTPSAGLHRHLSYGLYPMDSLAAEIEGSMRRELSVEEETVFQDQSVTAECVYTHIAFVCFLTRVCVGVCCRENSHLGQPGSPGGNNLTSALNRLSLRRQNFLCERQFFQVEREQKLQERAAAESEGGGSSCSSPMGSTVSSFTNLSEFSFSSSCFKTFLPEKLQIVKPMEGSLTLHHWQQLAKPHLATILDPHPGVVTKGFRPLPQDSVYHLTDLEEDEDQEKLPWEHKRKEKEPQDAKIKEEEEEEEGITFNVHSSSTPEETRERRCVQSPANVPPLPASLRNSPVPIATAISLATAINLTASAAPAVSSGISGSAAPQLEWNLESKAPSTGK
uniref:Trafficking protein, kinesin binding 2 n=1 Tax=Cyprinus carpio TaxID=7962 RepID=A0A8C1ZR38_CYPCA